MPGLTRISRAAVTERHVHEARILRAQIDIQRRLADLGHPSLMEDIKHYGYLCWDKGYDDGLEDGTK